MERVRLYCQQSPIPATLLGELGIYGTARNLEVRTTLYPDFEGLRMLRFHKFKNESKLQTLYSISATWLSTIRATVSQLQPDDCVRGDLCTNSSWFPRGNAADYTESTYHWDSAGYRSTHLFRVIWMTKIQVLSVMHTLSMVKMRQGDMTGPT